MCGGTVPFLFLDLHLNLVLWKWNSARQSLNRSDVQMEINEIAAKDKFDNFSGITQTSVTTDVRGEEHELRMKFALTSLNENTVYLPFWGNVRGYITWGDGSEEYIDKYVYPGDIRHSYKISSQEVVVAFRGSL